MKSFCSCFKQGEELFYCSSFTEFFVFVGKTNSFKGFTVPNSPVDDMETKNWCLAIETQIPKYSLVSTSIVAQTNTFLSPTLRIVSSFLSESQKSIIKPLIS